MRWHRYVVMMALGWALGSVFQGVWRWDIFQMYQAFIALALGWAFREMNLGWNPVAHGWKFLPFNVYSRSEVSDANQQ